MQGCDEGMHFFDECVYSPRTGNASLHCGWFGENRKVVKPYLFARVLTGLSVAYKGAPNGQGNPFVVICCVPRRIVQIFYKGDINMIKHHNDWKGGIRALAELP